MLITLFLSYVGSFLFQIVYHKNTDATRSADIELQRVDGDVEFYYSN